MKKSKYTLIGIILFIGTGTRAFGQYRVSGKVQNEAGQPVGYATVTLLKAADSSLVKGLVTDSLGLFTFSHVPSGKYIVAASLIGMVKTYSKPFEIGETPALPPLVLKPDTRTLKGVQVTASKPFIEHRPGETIVNVENSIVSAGNTAMEVLKKAPGVSVDNNDNISLRGKSGVTIMINGRPSHLSAKQVAEMLKTMPAGSISQIEIMTSPSSKFDAEGSSGIINIKLKKNANEGFNGSATAGWGQAVYPQAHAGVNLNYKRGKWNFFGGYHFNHRSWSNQLTIYRQYFNKDQTPGDKLEQPSHMRSPSDNHHFNAGIDYDIDSNNTIGILFNESTSKGDHKGNNITRIKSHDNQLRSFSKSYNRTENDWTNRIYNLHYKHVFDTAGTEISANMDYSRYNSHSLQHYKDHFFDADGDKIKDTDQKKGNVLSDIDVKSGKIDFTHPFRNKIKMEAGIKTSVVTSDNNVKYLNYKNKEWITDKGTSNHFIYTENINAAYLSLGKDLGKGWSAKAGLRGEQTIAKGEQKTTHEVFTRRYFQLFPTLFVQKNINKNNQLEFSYSRRIERPDYQRLNPFRYYIDPYTYETGNPLLRPELTRSLELNYIFKHVFTVSLNYSHTRDVINETINVDTAGTAKEHNVIYDTRDNIGALDHVSATFTASVPVTKWWTTNTNLTPLFSRYYGHYQGKNMDNAQVALVANSTNTFLLPKEFKAELSAWYHSPLAYGTMDIGSQGMISAGISKSLWDKKMDVKLNVNDIFNMGGSSGTATYPNMNMRFENNFSSRRVNLTLTWNFGNRKMKVSHHRNTGIEEEQNRIQK